MEFSTYLDSEYKFDKIISEIKYYSQNRLFCNGL